MYKQANEGKHIQGLLRYFLLLGYNKSDYIRGFCVARSMWNTVWNKIFHGYVTFGILRRFGDSFRLVTWPLKRTYARLNRLQQLCILFKRR